MTESIGLFSPAPGQTPFDDPTEPRHVQDADTNEALGKGLLRDIHFAGRHDQIRRFMSDELQIRHEPGVKDGVTAFEHDLTIITRDRTIDELLARSVADKIIH